jgi:outer membrane lipoprotein carrier protein
MRPRAATLLMLAVTGLLPAQTELSKLLKSVENRYNRPGTMQMSFQQTLTGGGRIGQSESGVLYLQKPGRMRWDYKTPAGKIFLADGKHVWFYSPHSGRVERSAMKESGDERTPLAFLMGRLDFYRDFKEFRTRPEGEDLYVIAKPKSERAPYEVVEFLVAPDARLKLLKVVGQDRSVMTLRFADEKPNPALNPALFRFTMPAGAELVDVASDTGP